MMMVWIKNQRVFIVMCAAMLVLCGCGGNDDEQQGQTAGQAPAETSSQAVTPSPDTGEQVDSIPAIPVQMSQANSMAEAEASRKQALLEMNDGKEIEPVDMGKLKEMLPASLDGMKRTDVSSEQNQMMGINISKAEGQYQVEGTSESIEIIIVDVGNLSGPMKMGMTGWTMRQYNRETEDGYEKTITYEGCKGVEKYDNSTKQGELHLFVADRFIVELNGYQTTMDVMKKALGKIDLKKLASLASGK
ncbi:MAG: hypothetical protein JW725_00895 [Candidatus Babeliaceae bacterium]|nr:hypothetical protein [Candidatus Babeliaceae bacterium]